MLHASDAVPGDSFGNATFDGSTILVGAYGAANGGAGKGYVITQQPSGLWSEQQQLVGSDSVPGDQFGNGLALGTDLLILGAPMANLGGNAQAGAAYRFGVTNGVWSHIRVESRSACPSLATSSQPHGHAV